MRRATVVLTTMITLAIAPSSAGADDDVAAPAMMTYSASLVDHSVIICPTAASAGDDDLASVCLESNTMVRENRVTDEVHSIRTCCDRGGDLDGDDLACVIDECVRPGTYRYGLVPTLECPPDRWTELTHYVDVEITEELGRCELSSGNLGRWPYSGDVDWLDLPAEQSCNEPSIPDDAPDAGEDTGEAPNGDDSGCACIHRSGDKGTHPTSAFATLLCLALLAARRRVARTPAKFPTSRR